MVKRGWIDVVDDALVKADKFADRFRKTPRRRLAEVPTPLVGPDPFVAPPVASSSAAAPVEAAIKPLGDAGLPAQIFGKRDDDATGRAVMVFREASMTARMINLDDPENYDVENRLIRETKRYEMPWVFLRGEYIGGFKELAALAKSGELIKRAGGES